MSNWRVLLNPCWCLWACLLPGTAGAWPSVPPWTPASSAGGPLSLNQALALALAHSPAVAQARANKAFSLGTLRLQQGAFDEVFSFSGAFSRETLPLAQGVYNNELGRRRLLRTLAITFEGLAQGIQQQLDSGVFGPLPECIETTITIGTTVTEIHCVPNTVFIDLEALLRGFQDAGIPEAVQAVRDAWRRQLELYLATSRFVAFVGRQLLRQQGVAPTIEDRDTLSYSLGLSKLYRNGIRLFPQVRVEAVRNTWRGKPLDPSFGGKGVLVSYTSRVGFELEVPLGRGGGYVTAQAAERASQAQAEAAALREGAVLQQTALATSVAYYNAAAARERWRLLSETVAREEKLLQVAQALAEADELPPGDLVLLQSRLAQARSQQAQARQAYERARVELLTAMGLAAEGVAQLPEVVEPLPSGPEGQALANGLDQAKRALVGQRLEVRAAQKAAQAARFLAEAAQADLRREVNFSFTAWYTGLHETAKTMAVTRWWPGVSKSFGEGFAGPSVALAVSFSLPFANSFARGRLASARALEQQALVQKEDLERNVRLRLAEQTEKLQARAAEMAARRQGVEAAAASLQAAQELFQAGELGMVDLILTEEALITAQLQLVNAQLALATDWARLRYELGELLPVEVVGTEVRVGVPVGL
ncbi:MAG: TolC family protein [Thermoanaerobaculum sp.]|nr:TolC family protein [Thermoanaerobaculum sp.]